MITLKILPADYQILAIAASPPDQPIHPAEIADLVLPPELDWHREVILFGQVPIWVYGALSATFGLRSTGCPQVPWIGYFAALEKEAVVVWSQVPDKTPGDVIPINLYRSPCPAILIGGPPDSGKSVLSNALRRSLQQHCPQLQVFLHRANWDGEGNWSQEAHNRDLVKRLIREHECRVHEHPQAAELLPAYYAYHASAISNLRETVDLVLVDVGGKTQPEKIPLVAQCTHYIVISRSPQLIEPWHQLCAPMLKLLAVIHSAIEQGITIHCSDHPTSKCPAMSVAASGLMQRTFGRMDA
jgi:CRISPR-associated protein Csx3